MGGRAAATVVALLALLATLAAASAADAPEVCAAQPNKPCVRKCCARGEIMDEEGACQADGDLAYSTPLFGGVFSVPGAGHYVLAYAADPCPKDKYSLEPDEPQELMEDGTLRAEDDPESPLASDRFCLDLISNGSHAAPTAFVCFPLMAAQQRHHSNNFIFVLGLIFSVVFLIGTLYVYIITTKLHSLYGWALRFFVASLSVAYVFLAFVQLTGTIFNDVACAVFAHIIQFFFVASFSWLTVLCFESCWNVLAAVEVMRYHPDMQHWLLNGFSDGLLPKDERANAEDKRIARKLLWVYSVCAWGLPLILLIIVIAIGYGPTVPPFYVKVYSQGLTCLLNGKYGPLYILVTSLLVINTVVMSVTIFYSVRFKQWHWCRRHPQRAPKQRAFMCLQLVISMYFYWMIEMIFWTAGLPPFSWVALDVLNSMMGLVVFCVFVMEPSVRQNIKIIDDCKMNCKGSSFLCCCQNKICCK